MMKEFRLPKGCSVKSFVVRETNGEDESVAIQRAKAKGDEGTVLNEMVRLALCVVDDIQVDHRVPYLPYDNWNSRTRAMALRAFTSLNATTDKEDDDFLHGAADYHGVRLVPEQAAISGSDT